WISACGDSPGDTPLDTEDMADGSDVSVDMDSDADAALDVTPTDASDTRPDGMDGDALPDSDVIAGRCPTPGASNPGEVRIEQGLVQGVQVGDTWVYRGVPFAAPPIDERRWTPPAEPACFDGVFDASEFGDACLQKTANGDLVGAEDCLTLNVW